MSQVKYLCSAVVYCGAFPLFMPILDMCCDVLECCSVTTLIADLKKLINNE